jgi:hypothetical protein
MFAGRTCLGIRIAGPVRRTHSYHSIGASTVTHDRTSKTHEQKRARVDPSESQERRDARSSDENRDGRDSIGEEFVRTIDSGDPFESLTRSTKRLWRGLID